MKIYDKSLIDQLKYKFPGCENIQTNFSQSYQDLFVLTMLNGKKNGTYIEIGAMHGQEISNTYLLDRLFGWSGISIDMVDTRFTSSFKEHQRTAKVLIRNALTIDYKSLFKENYPNVTHFDYLQLDIEPPSNTFSCLKMMPFDNYKFSVITFEHETYYTPDIREASREFILGKGYKLVCGNVCNHGNDPYEDWYIHPDLVSKDIVDIFKGQAENLTPDKLMLK